MESAQEYELEAKHREILTKFWDDQEQFCSKFNQIYVAEISVDRYDMLIGCVKRYDMLIGCFVHGLFLEGGGWDAKRGCIIYQKAKQLTCPLPVMKVIPIESHRLKLQVHVC